MIEQIYKTHKLAVLLSLAAVFVFIVGTISLLYGLKLETEKNIDISAIHHVTTTITNGEYTTSSVMEYKIKEEKIAETARLMSLSNLKYEQLPAGVFKNIVWLPAPALSTDLNNIFVDQESANLFYNNLSITQNSYADYPTSMSAYLLGKNNKTKIFLAYSYGSMDVPSTHFYFAVNDKKIYFVTQHSNEITDYDLFNKTNFVVDKTTIIPFNNTAPEKITDPSNGLSIILDNPKKEELTFRLFGSDFTNYFSTFFISNKYTIYLDKFSNKPFIFLSDGTFAQYRTKDLSDFAKQVTLNGKSIPLSNYSSTRTGSCGSRVFDVSTTSKDEVVKIGQAGNGDFIYKYKNEEQMLSYYNSIYYPDENGNNISFETFINSSPYFIWFDQFGRAVRYVKTGYQPAGECAKPVIYLYPKTDMKVSVQVEPNGGFTKTEPAYNSGWNVWATTKSELTNLADGASYPYLFWEGKAYNYTTPQQGFVLKREQVSDKMKIILAKLGLNQKETADFLEFWQPKLEVKPYVFVTFWPQSEFDKLAPLTISPQPDKIIRVFMDYEPLDYFVSVQPLKITTPEREGFTVVEWGGRLR